jgi:hypothetical protein
MESQMSRDNVLSACQSAIEALVSAPSRFVFRYPRSRSFDRPYVERPRASMPNPNSASIREHTMRYSASAGFMSMKSDQFGQKNFRIFTCAGAMVPA